LIIPFLLLIQLLAHSEIKNVNKGISEQGIDIDKSFNELTNEEYWLIRDEIGIHMKSFRRFITPKNYSLSDNEQRIIKQVKSIVQKKPVKDLKVTGKILFTALWILTFIIPIIVIVFYHIKLGIEFQ
jgi:hypothetical protein